MTPDQTLAWCRAASHRGDNTTLLEEHQYLNVPTENHTYLQKASVPTGMHFWHYISRPGYYRHILLEEWAALVWGLETRFSRPNELCKRMVHLGDNSPQIASQVKGRSSRKHITFFCQRSAAIEATGDFTVFTI